MRLNFIWVFLIVIGRTLSSLGQMGQLQGTVTATGMPVAGASVWIKSEKKAVTTGADGKYRFVDLPKGELGIQVTAVGYVAVEKKVLIDSISTLDIELEEDVLSLEQVVISASRQEMLARQAPVKINTISPKMLEATQALCIAEGLHFSPGLRVENNCSNCGFTQVRMNGLEGPYTQILINSRPVLSPLAAVYGLEILPANMIERIEVLRGGGSVLHGGNAIAGTINIITKEPTHNHLEASMNHALINATAVDQTVNVSGSALHPKHEAGISIYAYHRNRQPWDANNDGLSEITRLSNFTKGIDAYWRPQKLSKLRLSTWWANEYRRGGSDFDRPPHESALAEQVKHRILNSDISYELFSADYKHKLALYTALQMVQRNSYYGGTKSEDDSTLYDNWQALNAYGNTNDYTLVAGSQYAWEAKPHLMLTTGFEYVTNYVNDQMLGYQRALRQQVSTLGTYIQTQWNATDSWTLLAGARLDRMMINGSYRIGQASYEQYRPGLIAVPRVAAMYSINDNTKWRLSYSQGYRAPQAFNEDLHVDMVGGTARFIMLAQGLRPELSHSITTSWMHAVNSLGKQIHFSIDGFYTTLMRPFILSDPILLPNGVSMITKRNGDGAKVYGANLEAKFSFLKRLNLHAGATVQNARYIKPEIIWQPNEDTSNIPVVTSINLLRTPRVYGFTILSWKLTDRLELSTSTTFTGRMWVPHVVDHNTSFTVLRHTRAFLDQAIKIQYQLALPKFQHLSMYTGVQNLFNQFQSDFDRGIYRDAAYIYGPMKPFTLFAGIQVSL